MKYKEILFSLTLTCWSTVSVAQSLEEKIADKACECFGTNDKFAEGDMVMERYQNCLMQTLRQFEPEITGLADTIQGDTEYERGRKFGLYMSMRTQNINDRSV